MTWLWLKLSMIAIIQRLLPSKKQFYWLSIAIFTRLSKKSYSRILKKSPETKSRISSRVISLLSFISKIKRPGTSSTSSNLNFISEENISVMLAKYPRSFTSYLGVKSRNKIISISGSTTNGHYPIAGGRFVPYITPLKIQEGSSLTVSLEIKK